MAAYIDEQFCPIIGTEKQHRLICFLASKEGYSRLRDAAAEFSGISVSKVAKTIYTVKRASEMIDWLKAKAEAGEGGLDT